jgi:hypothetical protein
VSLKDVAEAAAAKQENRIAPSNAKMRNVHVTVDGIDFASKWEAHRYTELKFMQMAGVIKSLALQVHIPLVVNNIVVCEYIADFCYMEKVPRVPEGDELQWLLVIEDAKGGPNTPIFQLKRKLVYACKGITVRETRKRIRFKKEK